MPSGICSSGSTPSLYSILPIFPKQRIFTERRTSDQHLDSILQIRGFQKKSTDARTRIYLAIRTIETFLLAFRHTTSILAIRCTDALVIKLLPAPSISYNRDGIRSNDLPGTAHLFCSTSQARYNSRAATLSGSSALLNLLGKVYSRNLQSIVSYLFLLISGRSPVALCNILFRRHSCFI